MAKPVLVVAPLIIAEGRRYSPVIGGSYSCETGLWRNTPLSFAYQWYRSEILIPGATSMSYTPVPEDERWPLQCKVTATNADGSTETWADDATAKPVEGQSPPYPIGPPTLVYSDPPTTGEAISVDTGVWGGSPTSFWYQWLRNGTPIPGATGATFAPTGAEAGQLISCWVKARNAYGSSFDFTPTTISPVENAIVNPPVNTVLPVASGQPHVGKTVSCTRGTWTGDPPITYAYQWQRSGGDIPGATNSTYLVDIADNHTTIDCVVTASNGGGSVPAYSNSLGPVLAAPVNTAPPVIFGTPTVGQNLTCTTGTWDPAVNVPTYQWKRNGANIAGATSFGYTLQLADVGATMTCEVTETNAAGFGTALSNALGPVADNATLPVNTVAPALSGTPIVGGTLTCSTGTWTGSPTPTYDYTWFRTDPAKLLAPEKIEPYAANSYIFGPEDEGKNITCQVTATNRAGSVNANSNTLLVQPAVFPPSIVTAPVVSGTPTVGQTLSCTTGVWDGTPEPTYTYQWLRNGSNIASATSATYALVAADKDANVSCRVTATNSEGNASSTSNALGPVLQIPSNTALPTISGTTTLGSTLTCAPGTWAGSTPFSYAYQWRRNGVNISGQTASTYAVALADGATNISCQVTASNAAGTGTPATSANTLIPGMPVWTADPTISGFAEVNATLTCSDGTLAGGYALPITRTYQWLRNSTSISGATSSSYVVTTADIAANITCQARVTNAMGFDETVTNAIGPIVAPTPLNATYGSNIANTNDLATYTMSLQFGVADPDRIVVVGIGTSMDTGTVPVPTVTIGGVAASLVAKTDNGTDSTMMFAAKVPTGTSGNVVAAYGATMSASYMASWSIYGGAEVQPQDKAASANAGVYALDRYEGGVTIQYVYATSTTAGWTNGLVEDFDFAQFLSADHAGAHIENSANAKNLPYSVTNTGFRGTVMGSWLPKNGTPLVGIDFVGQKNGQNGGTVGTRTVTLDALTGGIGAAPLPGDIVFLNLGDVSGTVSRVVSSPGWTEMTKLVSTDSYTTNLQMLWKVMSDPVDVDVTFDRAAEATDGVWQLYVVRGIDPSSPMDVNPTTNTGLNTPLANPPAITPITPDTVVMAVGAGSSGVNAGYTSSDLFDFHNAREDNASVQICIGTGLKTWPGSGAVDPAAYGGMTVVPTNSWVARTMALRKKT